MGAPSVMLRKLSENPPANRSKNNNAYDADIMLMLDGIKLLRPVF